MTDVGPPDCPMMQAPFNSFMIYTSTEEFLIKLYQFSTEMP